LNFNAKIKLIKGMVYNDINKEYIGSFFGLMWAFIQPVSIIFVLWFVFEIGFKSKPINDVPFILWLSSGLLPWFFFANSLSLTTNSIISQSYLVKKISFPVIILPVVKIISQLLIHIFMMIILLIAFLIYGVSIDLYWLQLFYYVLASFVFLSGIGWILSSFVIFIKDIRNLVPIIIQFGFWGTPIFWSISMIPAKYHEYIKLNPFEYLIQGYRDSMIYKVWFWEKAYDGLYFWSISISLFIFGYFVFNRLKTHFVDII